MDGDECKCICKPGTSGQACEQGMEADGQQGKYYISDRFIQTDIFAYVYMPLKPQKLTNVICSVKMGQSSGSLVWYNEHTKLHF